RERPPPAWRDRAGQRAGPRPAGGRGAPARGRTPGRGGPVTTTLYFVRHTEVHNPRDLFYGRLPRFRISARGREQAERVADYLADEPIVAVYTSPLLRARQTAQVIAARHPGVPLRRYA